MSKVYPFPARVRTSDDLRREHEEAQRRRQAARGWFDEFRSRFSRAPIPPSDRAKIANGILATIERLEADPRLCKGAFSRSGLMRHAMEKYGLGESDPDLASPTKRLHEVTIRTEDMDNEQRAGRLAARELNYSRVINSLLDLATESPEAILEGIFDGTTLTEDQRDVASSREIAAELARRMARVDKVFKAQSGRGLAEVYAESAARKEVHQRQGGKVNWPFFDLDPDPDAGSEPGETGEFPGWRHPYWAPAHQFYGWRVPTCLDWLSAIAFLPRYFLGSGFLVEDWLSPGQAGDDAARDRVRAALTSQCRAAQDHAGQWRPLAGPGSEVLFLSADARLGPARLSPGEPERIGQMWIVLYPDRENPRRICPMLYWNQGEGGVHVVVLKGATSTTWAPSNWCPRARRAPCAWIGT